jgi:hypothetical protein
VVRDDGRFQIWVKKLSGDRLAVGCFNLSTEQARTTVSRREMGTGGSGRYTVRDLWTGRNLGLLEDALACEAAPHDTRVFLLSPAGKR